MAFDPQMIVEAVRSVMGPGTHPLQRPVLLPEDHQNVAECLLIDPLGYAAIEEFERLVARETGAARVVALSSGTAALHMALVAAGVQPGDEVIVPALTFVGTVNAVIHAGAIPHFVDVNSSTLGLNGFKLERHLATEFGNEVGPARSRTSARRLGAIIGVDLLGIPCAAQTVVDWATVRGVPYIEDAAEALGSRDVGGRPCGARGGLGILSFNNNKIVTTGGGGAFLAGPEHVALADRVRHLSTTAKVNHPYRYDHDAVGWNYRMPNVCAALGLGQMRRLPQMLERKRRLARHYRAAFEGIDGVRLIEDPEPCLSNRWLNAILFEDCYKVGPTLDELLRMGLSARAMFTPMHLLPMFKDCPRASNLMVAEDLARRLICLPSSVGFPTET